MTPWPGDTRWMRLREIPPTPAVSVRRSSVTLFIHFIHDTERTPTVVSARPHVG